MKKIKRLFLKDSNFNEPIALSTDLNTIDISDTLQTILTEKGITAENFEEVIIKMLSNPDGIKIVASETEPENMNPGDVWIKTIEKNDEV